MKTHEDKSFEERLERLETIVRTLETDPPSLKDSIDLYTEEKELASSCRRELEEAELKVEKMSG